MSLLTVSTPASSSSVTLPSTSLGVISSLISRWVRYSPPTGRSCFNFSWISTVFFWTRSSAKRHKCVKKGLAHNCLARSRIVGTLTQVSDVLMCLFYNGVVILVHDLPTLKRWSHTATKCFQNGMYGHTDFGKRTMMGERRNISPTENMNFCVSSGITSFRQPSRVSNTTAQIPVQTWVIRYNLRETFYSSPF